MDVLGSVDGVIDGDARAWLTISGEIDGAEMASAAWKSHTPMNAADFMPQGLSDEQRQQMQERMKAMSEMMGDGEGADALAQMFGGGSGEEQVTLRIMGVDPKAEKILRQGMIVIELPAFAVDDLDAMVGPALDAEINYNKNFGDRTGFHASSHDAGTDAYVKFDRLEIVAGGGVAEGSFGGTLCSISVLMQGDIDSDDCIFAEGRFETKLGEDPADG